MFCIHSSTLSSRVLETASRAIFYCVAITSELKYSFFGEDGSIQEMNRTEVLAFSSFLPKGTQAADGYWCICLQVLQ